MGLGMDRTAPRLQPETALGMTEIRRYRNLTKYIEILGMETPEVLQGVNDVAMRKIIQLHGKIQSIRRKIPTVFTMFPTPAFAASEGMPFEVYCDMVSSASVQPRKALKKLARHLVRKLKSTKGIQITTREPGIPRDYLLLMFPY